MPNVSITMVAGRPPEKKEDLIKKVTDAVVDALGVSKDSVHIALYEIPRENFGDGGIPLSKKKP
jgi:4-oxalocrotonate tautomerase